jgi:hypothetical protein
VERHSRTLPVGRRPLLSERKLTGPKEGTVAGGLHRMTCPLKRNGIGLATYEQNGLSRLFDIERSLTLLILQLVLDYSAPNGVQ